MTWCILDLETQNIQHCGHASSPHEPQNYIVAAAFAKNYEPVQSWYFNNKEEALASDWFKQALQGTKVLVAHNATFELHWLYACYPEELKEFLRNGGRIFCTQYAEYLLSHQTVLYPKLEDCSLKYGGTAKIDEVKLMWEQGYLTSEIPKDLLMQYLAGSEGDVENTRLVLWQQLAALKEAGMLPMFWERCRSMVFNAFATFNGLHINMQTAAENQKLQEQTVAECLEHLKQFEPADLPFEFAWGSDYHLSALIFGGAIKYKVKVPYDPPKYEKIDCWQHISTQLYHPVGTIPAQDAVCYSRGKNKGEPKVFSVDSDVEKLKWGEELYRFEGLLNRNALPAEVADDFFGKNAAYCGKRCLADDTPVYSTSSDALKALRPYLPIAEQLLDLAAADKDLGTYYLRESNGKQTGMLTLVDPKTNLIHHNLNNCATVTARLSSNKPNLQNIPRGDTSRVKEMFESRFPDGRMIEVDYTSLEVVVGAAYSHDKNMLKCLAEGTDMHTLRLAGFFDKDYDELRAIIKDDKHPEHQYWSVKRTWIKPISFADQYGASDKGLAYACGITLDEARQFKATQKKLFPELSVFAEEKVMPVVRRNGIDNMQREQNDAGVFRIYHRGYFQGYSGTFYSFREREMWKDGQQVMDYKPTEVANYWCQGEASFVVQSACGAVINALLEADFEGGKVLPVNTVHDAIYLDCATPELAIKWGRIVQRLMEETPARLCTIIPKLKDAMYDVVAFPAVPEYGRTLAAKEHLPN